MAMCCASSSPGCALCPGLCLVKRLAVILATVVFILMLTRCAHPFIISPAPTTILTIAAAFSIAPVTAAAALLLLLLSSSRSHRGTPAIN